MKRVAFLITFIVVLVCVIPLRGYAVQPPKGPQMTDYCSAPPFLVQAVEPNILIMMDMSGSMQYPAYGSTITCTGYNSNVAQISSAAETYDGTKDYYGYFRTDKFYQYGSNKFEENGDCTVAQMNDPTQWSPTQIPGNVLNWATMSRYDILRKILDGGYSASVQLNVHTLLSKGGTWEFVDAAMGCIFSISGGTTQAHELTVTETAPGSCPIYSAVTPLSGASVKVDVPELERVGVLQEISDRDNDNVWDDNAPRFGLMLSGEEEGEIIKEIQTGGNVADFNTAMQNKSLAGHDTTSTGEAIINALDYYTNQPFTYPWSGSANINADPWIDWCQLSYILVISDGEWNNAVDPVVPAREGQLGIYDGANYDLRTDLDGRQVVTTYTVYAFSDSAAGRNALQQTALYGGFSDKDANTWPYAYTGYPADSRTVTLPQTNCDPSGTYNELCYEWEIDENGIPDNYYAATEGEALKDQITEAIYDMLRRSSSGTSVSVLSTSAEGEGSLFQAYFNYEVVEGVRSVYWVGYLNGLWIDQYGNIREDTTQDQALVLTEDKVIEFFVDTDGLTKVKKYDDPDGNCEVYPDDADDPAPVTYTLQNLNPIWEGGEKLALRAASDRTIYAYIDDGDGVVESGEWGSDKFVSSNASTLEPFLNASDTTEAQNIINFTRGEHVNGMRDRRLDVNGDNTAAEVWKLSDIVYSTPVVVGPPMMKFHIIYGDSTYHEYYRDYKDRRLMVYVGANDGMLHAFNAGFYHQGDNTSTSSKTERGWYSDPVSNDQIGKEQWAYIPYNLLPHLKWLTDHDYCHVYYVDAKPKVVDARIFDTEFSDPDATHSYGWGTIIIAGMRLGGGELTCNSRTFRSAYCAIDITDPVNPVLLWEFTDADLGFTTSYPNVIRVGSRNDPGNWYAIFGSGVASYDGGADENNRYVYVLNLKTGALERKIDMKDAVGEDDIDNEDVFMADPISVDLGVDYQVDKAYIGATYCDLNKCDADDWKGKMFRINVNENTNVAQWTYSTMMSLDRPVTAAPSAAVDMFDRLWLYFGTGRYFSQEDREDLTTTQNLYGAWDPGTGTVDPSSELNDVTNYSVYENTHVYYNTTYVSTFSQYLAAKRGEYGSGSKKGWYITLTGGERSLHKPTILGGVVLFPTFQPTADVCAFGGTSYLYAPYYETGTAYEEPVIGYGTSTIEIDNNTYQEIARKITLGSGMPTQAVIHSGQEEGVVSLIQLGTGVIIQLEVIPALSTKSGTLFWEERR